MLHGIHGMAHFAFGLITGQTLLQVSLHTMCRHALDKVNPKNLLILYKGHQTRLLTEPIPDGQLLLWSCKYYGLLA